MIGATSGDRTAAAVGGCCARMADPSARMASAERSIRDVMVTPPEDVPGMVAGLRAAHRWRVGHYSQRNTRVDAAVHTTNISVMASNIAEMSDPAVAPPDAPEQRDRVGQRHDAGHAATAGAALDRHEQAGEPEHRIQDQRADRLREARRRHEARDQEADRQDAQTCRTSSATVNDTSGTVDRHRVDRVARRAA